MKKVAKFEKVSFEQFTNDYKNIFIKNPTVVDYTSIVLPKRATVGSAGYDFFMPIGVSLSPLTTIVIPTGIRVKIDSGYVLELYPRSGLGFKYKLQLDNTVGIIDSDYYHSKNEGHIMAKLTNHSDQVVNLEKGSGFIQGLFVEYAITYDDEVESIRDGGFGSTD